jgi:hypothetical protein
MSKTDGAIGELVHIDELSASGESCRCLIDNVEGSAVMKRKVRGQPPLLFPASGIGSKAAKRDHFKTGQRAFVSETDSFLSFGDGD